MLTPLDISEKEFRRSIRGYSEDEVDGFLDQLVKDYEQLYKENKVLKKDISELEGNLSHYRNLEETLNKTLVLAQETADELRTNAEKEAEMIHEQARLTGENLLAKAREELAVIKDEQRQLEQQAKVFRAQLKAALVTQLNLIEGENDGYAEVSG